jgi:hypothetical protein
VIGMNEDDLRELLHERGRDFAPDARISARLLRAAKRRIVARMATVTAIVSVAALAGTGLALEWRTATTQDVQDEAVLVDIDLADYYEGEEGPEEIPSREEVDRHVDCMRAQGFDLPDPQRTRDGWGILVDDPERYDMESPRWREAAFVTCAPPAPGPGDLFMPGFPQARIEAFRDCVNGQGFQLPEPTQTDTGGWRFDTSSGAFDFNDIRWKRALFVTCYLGPENDSS